jgi:hypothetical protein
MPQSPAAIVPRNNVGSHALQSQKKPSPSHVGTPLSQSAVTTAVAEQHWVIRAVRMCTAALMCAESHSAQQHTADIAPGAKHTNQRTLGRHTHAQTPDCTGDRKGSGSMLKRLTVTATVTEPGG